MQRGLARVGGLLRRGLSSPRPLWVAAGERAASGAGIPSVTSSAWPSACAVAIPKASPGNPRGLFSASSPLRDDEPASPAEAADGGKQLTDVTVGDVNSYFALANAADYSALQSEVEVTGTNEFLLRACVWEAVSLVSDPAGPPAGAPKGMFMDGRRGAGKSVALAAMVERARASGWLVLHVRSGRSLCTGGTYSEREDSLYDTPEVCRELLRGFLGSHDKGMLEGLACKGKGREGKTLMALVEEGVGNLSTSVDAACALREELSLMEERPVLIAIDGYNGMFWKTDFSESVNVKKRRMIRPEELRGVRAWRALEGVPLANGIIVGSISHSIGVSPKLQVPIGDWVERVRVPRLGLEESRIVLDHYRKVGVLPLNPTEQGLQYLHTMSGGSVNDLRTLALLQ